MKWPTASNNPVLALPIVLSYSLFRPVFLGLIPKLGAQRGGIAAAHGAAAVLCSYIYKFWLMLRCMCFQLLFLSK